MKRLVRVYKWVILAVLFQVIVFSYLEFVYLPNRGAVKATAYELNEESIKSKSLNIPSNASDIRVSFNGLYVAYKQNERLIISDIRNGKKLKTLDAASGTFSYFRWLPDRDMLIFSVKAPDGKQGQVKISTFDLGPGLERSYPQITDLPDDSEIVDIELSPLTNVVYTMIRTGESKIKVYKYNIMDNLDFIMNTGIKTIFKETAYSDNLIYQTDTGKITVKNGKSGKNSSLPIKGKLLLLSVDAEDTIFAGQLDESDKVIAVYQGKLDSKSAEWKKTELNAPTSREEIFITPDGSIYQVSKQSNHIIDASDGSTIPYDGDFLDVLDDYVVSKDDNRLRLTAVTKE